MWKKLRLPLLILAAGILIAVFFSWQLKFLYVPVRAGLEKLTGQHVTFRKIDYRLFNRVTVQDLTIGSTFRARNITVYFNPWRLVTNLRDPQASLLRVHFSEPSIAVTPELREIYRHCTSAPGTSKSKSDFKVSWTDAIIVHGDDRFDHLSGQVILGKAISGRMTGKYRGEQLSIGCSTDESGDITGAVIEAKMTGQRSDAAITIKGTRGKNGDISAVINAPRIRWDSLSITGSSGTFHYSTREIAAEIQSNAGRLSIRGNDPEHITGNADIELASLLSDTTGSIRGSFTLNGSAAAGEIAATNLSRQSVPLGDITCTFKNDTGSVWSFSGLLAPSSLSFNGTFKNNNDLQLSLSPGKKGYAKIEGTITPLRLSITSSSWPASQIPVLCSRFPGIRGTLDASGILSSSQSDLSIDVDRWQIKGGSPLSCRIRLFSKEKNWFLKAETTDTSAIVNAKMLASKDWDITGKFDKFPLDSLLPWLSINAPLAGRISGTSSYSSAKEGALALKIEALALNGTAIGVGKVEASLSKDALKIRDLSLHSGKGTVTAFAQLALNTTSSNSSAVVRFYHFPLKDKSLHGAVDIKGILHTDKNWMFNGSLESGGFQYDRWKVQKIRSAVTLSADRLELKGLQIDSAVNGSLSLGLNDRTINGTLGLKRLPLTNLTPQLQGSLSGSVSLKGTVDTPSAVLTMTVPDARYQNSTFAVSGKIRYQDQTVTGDEISISSGSSALLANGQFWPALSVKGTLQSLSTGLIENTAHISLPLRGVFSGAFEVAGTHETPQITAELSGQSVFLASLPLSECSMRFSATKDMISIASLSTKFTDSELKVLPESTVNLKARTFSLRTECRNVHAGPADLFGGLYLSGDWNQGGKKTEVNGTVTTENFWINQHVLNKASFAVSYKNNLVSFIPRENQPLKIGGAIDLGALPEIAFKQWRIDRDDRSLTIDGIVSEKRWDFTATGRRLSGEVLTELIDIPFPLEGAIDMTIVGRGSVDHPQLEASINIANGSAANIPFDNLNLQVSAHQDVLSITQARLLKKDQYTVVASGFLPFFLTADGKKRIQNRPLDLTVRVDEGTLNLLKGISSDIRSASGDLRAQARLTGTFAKPVGNGYVRIVNGDIESNRYFNRLSGLSVDLQWKDNLLTIKDFNGRIGDGRVRMKGGLVLEGFAPKSLNIAFFTDGSKGVQVSIPELPIPSPLIKNDEWKLFSNLSHGEPRFSVQLSGPVTNTLFSGWIELENTHFTYPPPVMAAGEGENIMDSLWPVVSWDLELRSGKNTWYDNDLVSVNILGDIKLSGKGAYPTVNGRVESVRGTITYLGREFSIKEAVLEINRDKVFVEGKAETDVSGKTANDSDVIQLLIDRAEVDKIKPRFISKADPTMAPEKAMAKATGVNPESYSSGADQDFLMRQQLIRLIDSSLATPLARSLLSRSGIADSFRVRYLNQEPIKPAIPGSPTLSELLYGTKYSLEKYLTNQFLFGYSVTFDQIQNRLDLRHSLELSYRLQKNTFLTGTYELETNNPLRQHDRRITLEQQWRFGWTKKK